MSSDNDPPVDPLLQELLERGVPWHLAIEAIASTRLDLEPRVQTHSARDWQRDEQ